MPQDTIKVNLVDNALQMNVINYYRPLLIFKSEVLDGVALMLTSQAYEDDILNLKMISSISSDQSKQQTAKNERGLLTRAVKDYFDEGGFKSLDILLFKDIKEVKAYLKVNLHPFVCFVNPCEDKNTTDITSLVNPNNFIVFSKTSRDLPTALKSKKGRQLENLILFYNKETTNKEGASEYDNTHIKFISQYLHQASMFHATNPYGIRIKAEPIITDTELISSLRGSNINFYTLLNETGYDGILAIKEGVDLAGRPIDEIATYAYIKNKATEELIRIWNANNRSNSKLSTIQLEGASPNVYTSALEVLFKRFKDNGLIFSFSDIKFKIEPIDNALRMSLSVMIQYNHSLNTVELKITAEDINAIFKGDK
ncbi:hypothetical protein DB313_05760 (plasmid) [Borrelia turcica IST7]|uniref:Uncharacterized protein n=1 Tax=Borrelia turcica IST7 TaxID=1104446 RepID=A0A386PPW2_9SPIR|nr:DUF787 family protein [Borrelia turcica]AYE37005.1 hypothetical protein DB313_05760 [Borrelia turcica IST7]